MRPKSAQGYGLAGSKSQRKLNQNAMVATNQFISAKNSLMKNSVSPSRKEVNNFHTMRKPYQDIDPMLTTAKKFNAQRKS